MAEALRTTRNAGRLVSTRDGLLEGAKFAHDFVQADLWLRLAAAHGGEFFQSQLTEAERQMTPDQIAQAKALVEAWKPKVVVVPGVDQH